jgi:hypothetical protein
MAYLLDANVFIQAKNLHYGFDFCPAFWDWIVQKNGDGQIFSIERVAEEIAAGDDELTVWAASRGDSFFLEPDAALLGAMPRVSQWVMEQAYDPAAVNTFLQVADYYLVSHGLAHNLTVVTHEVPANSVKRIKIPNVCIGLGIRFMTPYEMLRREGARFVLGSTESV